MGLISEIVEYANSENSKLNNKALSLPGMSSKKVRNLLNIEEATLVADYEGDPNSWRNGIWIALLQK